MQILETTKTIQGHKIELIGTQGTEKVLIIGVFHGDEPQGKYLIERYIQNHSCPPLEGGPESMIPRRGNKLLASHQYTNTAKNNAKILRNNLTTPEIILWQYLKNKQIDGLKFRRQQPVGKYIVDFMCCNPKVIIELDGGQHNTNKIIEYDNIRETYLINQGYQVIRIWNNEIHNNIENVIAFIKKSIKNPTQKSKISTLPQGEGISPSLLFIPCLNPDGMQNNTRTNANGVDLNRNFPTKNWGQDTSQAGNNPSNYYGGKSPASEIETKFVIDVIEKYKPTLILTLHAPYKVVNYDGPAEQIAQKISDIINYPVEASIGYPTPGSFGTYCGVERNIPTITLELDEEIPVEELVQPVFKIFDTLTA